MADKDLKKICQRALESHGLQAIEEVQYPKSYWNEEFHQVENTSLFAALTLAKKSDFLTKMSSHILQEACAIEKAGLTYSARMNLMSKSLEEKILYSLIGAEEALHLKSLEPFLPSTLRGQNPAFADLILQWIENLERTSLLVMIQILLEGWGLSYYGSLAHQVQDPRLKSVFLQILLDESRHHATGVILYRKEKVPISERADLENQIMILFDCVQNGPQQAAIELSLASGQKSIDFEKVFFEMKAFENTHSKLEKLKQLLEKCGDTDLLSETLLKKISSPYSLKKMAQHAHDQYSYILKNPEPAQDLI